MEVKVDIKNLIHKLEKFNPTADLTGVKAYLLDLALGVDKPSFYAPVTFKADIPAPAVEDFEESFTEEKEATSQEETAHSIAKLAEFKADTEDLAFWDEAEAAESVKTSIKKSTGSPLDRKKAREEKRSSVQDYSKMSSREIMEHLAAESLIRKKPGQNQFVDIGGESSSGEDFVLG